MSKRATSNYSQDESGGDSDDDINQPSGAECLTRCQDFAQITGTDTALAMFYLQDVKWDLQKALDSFFRATDNVKNKKVVACFDVDRLNNDEKNKNKKTKSDDDEIIELSSDEECAKTSKDAEEEENKENDDSPHFKILSWNIDGLDQSAREMRTNGVIETLLREKPDIVLLQEVVNFTKIILEKSKLNKYYVFASGCDVAKVQRIANLSEKDLYFTMILVRKSTCELEAMKLVDFENSVMLRNLLQVSATYKKQVKVCCMTAHLESTADFAKQRIEQLKMCFDEIKTQTEDTVVFFGGDLNLRDKEVGAIGGPPKGIVDVWEATGSRKECLYTWDCSRNTNVTINSKYKPRCRFDRLYFRGPQADECATLVPAYFELEGLEKLKSCGRFCSDHWAIQAYCNIEVPENE